MSTRITPVWRNSAATVSSELASAAVCEDAALRPTAERPDFTATTGLERLNSRASRANLRGLPNDSRYRSATPVASSSPHHDSRSFPLTSALLPIDTKLESPMPRFFASARMAMPRPPDWEANPRRPDIGVSLANVAFIEIVGIGVEHPEAVGPDHPHAVGMGQLDRLALKSGARHAVFGEMRRHDHQATHSFSTARLDNCGDGCRWDSDHGQVDNPRDIFDAGKTGHARDVGCARVHGVDRPLETSADEVADKLMADSPRRAGRPYDGDRVRPQQAGHRTCRRFAVPLVQRSERLRA